MGPYVLTITANYYNETYSKIWNYKSNKNNKF